LQVGLDEGDAELLGDRERDDHAAHAASHDVHALARDEGLLRPRVDHRFHLARRVPHAGDGPLLGRPARPTDGLLDVARDGREGESRLREHGRELGGRDSAHLVTGVLKAESERDIGLDAAPRVHGNDSDPHVWSLSAWRP
jgi:hypothetical protein